MNQPHTHIREFEISQIIGENWSVYARTHHQAIADEIATLLLLKGRTVRITEIHEGAVFQQVINPGQSVVRPTP